MLEVWLSGLVMGLGLSLAVPQLLRRWPRPRWLRPPWEEVAGALGLNAVLRYDDEGDSERAVLGPLDGIDMEIHRTPGIRLPGRLPRIRITARVPSHRTGPTVRPRGLLDRLPWLRAKDALPTGCPTFDACLSATGADEAIVGLDAWVRENLLSLVHGRGARVGGGRITLDLPDCGDVESIVWTARRLAAVAARLSPRAGTVWKRLLENATRDPVAGVRARNLEVLLRRYPGSPEALLAGHRAWQDPDPDVRAVARRLVAMPTGDSLRGLLEARGIETLLSAEAFDRLLEEIPVVEILPALDSALETARGATLLLVVRALIRLRRPPSPERLVARLETSDVATTQELASALGELGDVSAEPALIALLGHADVSVRIRAAASLGWIGTGCSVEPLLGCARSRSRGRWGTLQEAARSSVRSIQERLPHAPLGSLSIASGGPDSGALSLAVASGELSVARPAVDCRVTTRRRQ
ncbi:MAG: HEAT repeat domain-containing protein [Planctomycetes bacterium]|nr:HEAT repeat domain-containing protein [Planctomycetota bacterium]